MLAGPHLAKACWDVPLGFLVESRSFEMEWLVIKANKQIKTKDSKVSVLLSEAYADLTANSPGGCVFGGLFVK